MAEEQDLDTIYVEDIFAQNQSVMLSLFISFLPIKKAKH